MAVPSETALASRHKPAAVLSTGVLRLLIAAGLTLLIWAVFAQTRHYDFVNFDDDKYVYEDPNVLQPVTAARLLAIFVAPDSALWHPLTTFSHILDYHLFGLTAGYHHLVNVGLHNIGAILLFAALARLTGAIWPSAFVAAVFAIHPMRVESVAWVTERKDVLTGVFLGLTLLAYHSYARTRSMRSYVAVALAFAGGLMAKPTFLTIPAVLLLLDYWPLRRTARAFDWLKLIAEKIPLFLFSGVAFAQTIRAQSVTLPSLEQLAVLPRLKNAVVSIVIYLRQMLWPSKLAIFYPHPHDQISTPTVVLCLCLVVGITVAAILLRKSRPYLFVGWFWFLAMLVPVLGIIQAGLQGHADRFTYLPHIGVTVALAWMVRELTGGWRARFIPLATAGAALMITMAMLSWKQTTYWRDSETLWRRDLAVADESYTANQNLASALWRRGEEAESRKHSHRAQVVRWATAVRDYPEDVKLRDNLGVALIQSGDAPGAVREWTESVRIDPHDGNALNNLAWVLATHPDTSVRDGQRAVEFAQRAVEVPGGNTMILLRTLAASFAEAGDFANAVATAQRAIDMAMARGNSSLAETLRHELALYTEHQAYRESPPTD